MRPSRLETLRVSEKQLPATSLLELPILECPEALAVLVGRLLPVRASLENIVWKDVGSPLGLSFDGVVPEKCLYLLGNGDNQRGRAFRR